MSEIESIRDCIFRKKNPLWVLNKSKVTRAELDEVFLYGSGSDIIYSEEE